MRNEEKSRLTRYWITSGKWISGETALTGAYWAVVDDLAVCILSAGSRTRIYALLIDAGFVAGTLGASDALWSTAGWTSDVG